MCPAIADAADAAAPLARAQAGSLDTTGRIRDAGLQLGFDAIGFASADLTEQARERLAAFIAAGRHGSMGWLAERTDQRSHPRRLWPDVQSVIVAAMSYAPAADALANLANPGIGNISVYARNRDYHDLIKGRLKHLAQFVVSRFGGDVKVFVDTAPVMEKNLAERAGLGWQGRHTNLVSRAHGSWLLLGEVYTTLALHADTPAQDRCGSCTRCQDICPTQAFPAPYQLDARRCISYLTIEHHGPIPLEFRKPMGNRIYGCDDCLAVCPWNKFSVPATQPGLRPRQDLTAPALADLVRLDDAAFRAMFSASPVKRIGRNRFIRNVLIAIGNAHDRALLPAAQSRLDDPDPVVRDAASWACAELTPR